MWTILIIALIVIYALMFLFVIGASKQNKRYDDCFDNYVKNIKNGKT